VDGKPVEIQVRTALQHKWAEVSEKLSDTVDTSLKYGGAVAPFRSYLDQASDLVGQTEGGEQELLDALKKVSSSKIQLLPSELQDELKHSLTSLEKVVGTMHERSRRKIADILDLILKEKPGAVSD
jgi:ppGpp synthetase/RelA/SpoT-type nucleotidyltranferase